MVQRTKTVLSPLGGHGERGECANPNLVMRQLERMEVQGWQVIRQALGFQVRKWLWAHSATSCM